MLNWVEKMVLRRLASDNRLFGKISEPGWVLMDLETASNAEWEARTSPMHSSTPSLETCDLSFFC